MADHEKRLELEPEVVVGDRVLVPVAWTVGGPVLRGHSLSVSMCREAFGVIVRSDGEDVVLLVDGRVMSVEEFADAYPALHDALDSLRRRE